MFAFTYLPQLAVLVFVNGPIAPITTVLLILSESSAIINMISRGFLLQDALLDTFDGTLLARNATAMVSQGRELKDGTNPMNRLGKILKSPFDKFSPTAMVRYLMYLPLNFIPVVGTVMFVYLQGKRSSCFRCKVGNVAKTLYNRQKQRQRCPRSGESAASSPLANIPANKCLSTSN